MALLCLMWCLWKEWNAQSYEDCETGPITLKKLVIQTLFMWRVTLQSMSACSYLDFLDLCSFFSLNLGYHVYILCTLGYAIPPFF
jgi:hypothetical protein